MVIKTGSLIFEPVFLFDKSHFYWYNLDIIK